MELNRRDRRGLPVGLAALTALALTAGTAGCSRDFEAFNLVDKLRVLGVRAEPPSLAEGELAALTALVYEPDGDPVSYRWSWCPLPAGQLGGFECAVDEQQLIQLVEAVAPGLGDAVPSLSLGTDPEALFFYPVPAELLRDVCEAIASFQAPAFVELPDCDEKLVVTIELEVSAGDESVVAVKELPLYFDPDRADNENPTIGQVTAGIGGEQAVLLSTGAPPTLLGDRSYRLSVQVPAESAQELTPTATDDDPAPDPRRERLFMTWFITGGDTERNRTSFIDGEIPLDELGSNVWKTPDDAAEASLFLVLQDERGGVGWIRRDVLLAEE